jgi:hypothetical protein
VKAETFLNFVTIGKRSTAHCSAIWQSTIPHFYDINSLAITIPFIAFFTGMCCRFGLSYLVYHQKALILLSQPRRGNKSWAVADVRDLYDDGSNALQDYEKMIDKAFAGCNNMIESSYVV